MKLAVEEGGQIVLGGDKPQLEPRFQNGYWINPAIITGTPRVGRLFVSLCVCVSICPGLSSVFGRSRFHRVYQFLGYFAASTSNLYASASCVYCMIA